jgi:methyl coenzyme M reductase subunit C-like uncharacterized protein (methanogenesis marker protein 7)
VRDLIGVLGRVGAAARPASSLLRNYLGEARAIARSGGGSLWVIEPRVPRERLPEFSADVVRYLRGHGVETGTVKVLAGTTSARIQVLPSR